MDSDQAKASMYNTVTRVILPWVSVSQELAALVRKNITKLDIDLQEEDLKMDLEMDKETVGD